MPGERAILTLLAQIVLILALTRVLGWIVSRFGQPQVLGEMLAGIILGPSLLGWAAPQTFHHLFPADSLQFLAIFSQIGLTFFVFLMGLQLDPALSRARGKSSIALSLLSIGIPFGLGLLVVRFSYEWPTALFMATALSVSAFAGLA